MKRLHVLIVSRRYWPHCDDASQRLVQLVEGLRRAGVVATVLTPQYASQWPMELEHRETRVLRPFAAPRGDWSIGRYTRSLTKWLRENISRYDLVYCDSMRDEGSVVVELGRKHQVPTVLRCGTSLGESDLAFKELSRSTGKSFERCLSANNLIASTASIQQSLLVAGAQATVITRIPDGVRNAIPRDPKLQKAARLALQDINADFCVPQGGKVVLSVTRLAARTGASQICSSLAPLIEHSPLNRVWMIGDGIWRPKIFNEVKHLGMQGAIVLPGSFDHVTELLQAADAFLLPSTEDAMQFYWPAAIAAGLPSVVVDNPDTRAYAGASFSQLHAFPSDRPQLMKQAMADVLDNIEQVDQSAIRIRNQLATQTPLDMTIDRHVQLFQTLCGGRSVAARGATG